MDDTMQYKMVLLMSFWGTGSKFLKWNIWMIEVWIIQALLYMLLYGFQNIL